MNLTDEAERGVYSTPASPWANEVPAQTKAKVILSLSGIAPASPSQHCCVIYLLGFTICSRMQHSLAVFWKGAQVSPVFLLWYWLGGGGSSRFGALASEDGRVAEKGLPVLCSVSTLLLCDWFRSSDGRFPVWHHHW